MKKGKSKEKLSMSIINKAQNKQEKIKCEITGQEQMRTNIQDENLEKGE